MRLQVGKWGNSLAVRLPAALTQKIAITAGDYLDAEVDNEGCVSLAPSRRFDKASFLRKLDRLNASLPPTESVMQSLKQEQRY